MADQEPNEPQQEPQPQPQQPGGILDSHGQPGISRAKYDREVKAWKDQVAELKAQLDQQAKAGQEGGDRVAKLEDDLKAMRQQLDDERLAGKLAAAGCVNVKAAKAVLGDYDGDIEALKKDCPYLFRRERQTGSTGGTLAGEFGNGDQRRAALGSLYDAVQQRVNELCGQGGSSGGADIDDLARRAINGEFGNGDQRRAALGDLYDAVQARVNEMLS